MYDTIIIGGGISGLYCAINVENVLLLEENDYLGGRIKTHYQPQYEMGAGRFNKTHKYLWSLIKRFNLTPVSIPNRIDYGDENEGILPHIEEYLLSQLKKMKLHDSLREMTFFDYCVKVLGKEDAIHFVEASGYYELYYKNAYDELQSFQKDYVQGDYYFLKEGMSELCNRMSKEIKGNYILNHKVKSIEREKDYMNVDGYKAKRVIVSIPPSLFNHFPILSPYDYIISNIKNGPLLRIYAKYPTEWTDTLHKITTKHKPRHIIPIRDGIVMIAYVEDKDILPFLNGSVLKKNKEIRIILRRELKKVFGLKVPEPEWIRPYLWKIGTHAWIPGPSSKLLENLPQIDNLLVCGEAFSVRQAWIEGAIESSVRIL